MRNFVFLCFFLRTPSTLEGPVFFGASYYATMDPTTVIAALAVLVVLIVVFLYYRSGTKKPDGEEPAPARFQGSGLGWTPGVGYTTLVPASAKLKVGERVSLRETSYAGPTALSSHILNWFRGRAATVTAVETAPLCTNGVDDTVGLRATLVTSPLPTAGDFAIPRCLPASNATLGFVRIAASF